MGSQGAPAVRRAAVLTAEGLTVTYGPITAVADVSLSVPPGRLVAVTGPSGAGKSSLLWALAGAVLPHRGEARFDSHPIVGRHRAARLGIALIPQGNGLADMLTASENVLVPLLDQRVRPVEARERGAAALAAVGLAESGDHLVEELSGGQQQRVAVARGLASRASVLLADEPTSDLDAGNREGVVGLLRAEADAGAVVLMATHDPEAAREADAELALDQGAMRWVRPLPAEAAGRAD